MEDKVGSQVIPTEAANTRLYLTLLLMILIKISLDTVRCCVSTVYSTRIVLHVRCSDEKIHIYKFCS